MKVRQFAKAMVAILALGASAMLSAQGGQAGGAAGGGGGSMGPGDETRATHILSPGDTATWPIKAKEGEVVIARVTSTTFDPAVEVVDAAGKVLGQNDDIRPGMQDALVLTRLPEAGDYTVQVKAYKGGSGGQYTITFTRFVPEDAKISARNSGTAGRNQFKWLRFPAVKGQTFSLSALSNSYALDVSLYNPTGLEQDMQGVTSGGAGQRRTFRAEHTGDHYLRLIGERGFSYSATVSPARMGVTAIGKTESRKLETGGLDIWTFDAKAGDLLYISARTKGAVVVTQVSAAAKDEETGTLTEEAPMIKITGAAKSDSDDTILIRRDGKFEVSVIQSLSLAADYELSIEPITRTLGDKASGTLAVGHTDFFGFDGKAGDVVDISATAAQFDANVTLIGPDGERLVFNDDGAGNQNARLVFTLPSTGRFFVGVHAFGNGGGGQYEVTRRAAAIRPLAKGAKGESVLGSGTAEIWSFSAKTGQAIVISGQSEELDIDIVILAPDGTVVATGADEMGTNSLASFVIPLDGTYTIWVRGGAGSGKYVVRWLDLND